MLGAIAGDIIGSIHEGAGTKTKSFPLWQAANTFTDDTVLTVAVAEALLSSRSYAEVFREYYRRYPDRGYGSFFWHWVNSSGFDCGKSLGNGSAMRVSPVAWVCDTLEDVLAEAQRSAEITHGHPEAIRGAQAVAAAIFLARTGHTKEAIRQYIERHFYPPSQYPAMRQTLEEIRPSYGFDPTCPGSVPQSLVAFLESTDFEDALRNAISLGGDADTMACIAGSIAEAYYGGVPSVIAQEVLAKLDEPLRQKVEQFRTRYVLPRLLRRPSVPVTT